MLLLSIFIANQKYIPLIYLRNFSTGNILNNQNGRFMKKVMKEAKKKKRWNNEPFPTPALQSARNLSEGATEGSRSSNARRISVLNKLFMRYITDLMASGECATAFLGRGIEINKVKVTPDFQNVNVFWIAKGTEEDDELETILTQQSGNLRHELSQLRVMGNVPRIHFVKDKEYAKLMEVDLRLAKADFGEDYVPVQPSYMMKSEFQLNTRICEELKTKIQELESNNENEEECDEPLPPMRTDVFGLNHKEIMEKVVKSIKKSKALHRQDAYNSTTLEVQLNQDPTTYASEKQQKEAFMKFLQKRQIMREKARREKEKCPEILHVEETREILDDSQFWHEVIATGEDYIEEFEDETKL